MSDREEGVHFEVQVECNDCGWGDSYVVEDVGEGELKVRESGDQHRRNRKGHSVRTGWKKLTPQEYANWLLLQKGRIRS